MEINRAFERSKVTLRRGSAVPGDMRYLPRKRVIFLDSRFVVEAIIETSHEAPSPCRIMRALLGVCAKTLLLMERGSRGW